MPASAKTSGTPPSRRSHRTGYLPSLDGWRALAILAVVMNHDAPWSLFGHSNLELRSYGGWGVYLFFAISGVLVCTRILEDEAILGRLRLGRFYLRRIFRIQPAAIAYLAAIALLTAIGVVHERRSALLGGLFLYQNYLYNATDRTGSWFLTGHFWTLAVEEHFYLLLSLLLFYFRRRRELVFSLVLVLALLWVRYADAHALYASGTYDRRTEFQIQYLLAPALLAILLRRKPVVDFALRYLRPWVVFLATALLKELWLLRVPLPPALRHNVLAWATSKPPILFFAFGFWVVATMLHPRSWTTRFLELPPLRFVGRLSYSIYLWHVLFLASRNPLVGVHAQWLLWLASRPWNYVATAAAALLSYYWVEKPLIRLGHRLAPPATPGHEDLRGQPEPVAAYANP